MLTVLAAQDFGYVTADQIVKTLTRSLETIGKLKRHEGHLFNWYAIRTNTPLGPRYVSTALSVAGLLQSTFRAQQTPAYRGKSTRVAQHAD